MCSIVQLLSGTMIDYEYLFNAMHNNEHGIGVLLKANGKIYTKKELPVKVDVDKFYKYLEENKDVERWFHLRNCSSGDVSKANVQPIQVYHSSKRDVFFMHNGTIMNTQLVPESQKSLIDIDINDNKLSDSVRFAMSKIAPVLLRTKGQNGMADIEDPFVQEILINRWQYGHGRGVLISSDQNPLLLNSANWEKIKNKDGTEFLASNDDYFKELKRGTLYDERKREREAKEAKNTSIVKVNEQNSMFKKNGRDIHSIEYPPFHHTLGLSEQVMDMLEEYDLYSPEGYIALGYIDKSELYEMFKENPYDATTMFIYLTSYLKDATISQQELVKLLAKTNRELADIKKQNVGTNKKASNGTGSEEVHVG